MLKKRIALGALTASLVFGCLGLFNRSAQSAPVQTFSDSGVNAISVDHCYDTVASNTPVTSSGRLVCNAANLNFSMIPSATAVYGWTIVNLPIGNRLTLPTTYTPSGVGQWSYTSVACTTDANNRCTQYGGAGTSVGNFTARTDVACNGLIDVLATFGPGGVISSWPNDTFWTPASTSRIAQSLTLGGSGPLGSGDEDAYIHKTVPFPTSGVNAFSFLTADISLVPLVFLGGAAPLVISPSARLGIVAYESSHVPGLAISTILLGGSPSSPPSDNLVLCFDSPQDSVVRSDYAVTPAGGRIPRWTVLQSDADLGDHTANRILDWQCDVIGLPVGSDSDAGGGDCLEDSSPSELLDCDPGLPVVLASTKKDCDNDLVPDGVEMFSGSNPNDADGDTDNDGASDYDELFQFTNPAVADSDGDGQADKQDLIPTNGLLPSSGCLNPEIGSSGGGTCTATAGLGLDQFDTTDDNCPAVANTSQLNTDSLWQYHGMGGNVTAPNSGTGDRTNPDEDLQGDACDTDDDNDGMPDTTEVVMRIRSWSGNQDDTTGGGTDPEGDGDGTSLCAGPAVIAGTFVPIRVMSPVMGDVDYDYVLDGRECSFRSRPDASIRLAGGTNEAQSCVSGAVTVITGLLGGCAQPAGTTTTCLPTDTIDPRPSPSCSLAAGPDSDALGTDGLYLPFGGPAGHFSVEVFYRTLQISTVGTPVADIDGDLSDGANDNDSDRDLRGLTGTAASLKDGIEVRFLNTAPSAIDSDSDGCEDGDEWLDMSGDGAQNIADTGLRAVATGSHDSPADGQIDVARYALGTNRDFNKDGTNNIADSAILAAAIGGTACPAESGPVAFPANRATKHLP